MYVKIVKAFSLFVAFDHKSCFLLSIDPSTFLFLLNTYLELRCLQPGGRSTGSQVWLCSLESISLLIASFHMRPSVKFSASLKVRGSPSSTYFIKSRPKDFFFPCYFAAFRFYYTILILNMSINSLKHSFL